MILQTVKQLLIDARSSGISIDEIIDLIDREIGTAFPARRKLLAKVVTCPLCGRPLSCAAVNTGRCNQVDGKYKSILYCVTTCGYEELQKKKCKDD